MPSLRLSHFSDDIVRARDLVGLGQSIGSLTHGRVDASDMYRAALVQAVAALDSYVHGVVLDRAVDVLMGRLTVTATDAKVGLPFVAVTELLNAQTSADRELACRQRVAARLSLETFQRPDDIARAFAMVGLPKIWTAAFAAAEPAKTAIRVIVTRRNNIVHACDVDPLTPGAPVGLSAQDAADAVDTVEATVQAIDGTI
jgi:hypothetical protein